MTVTIQKSRQVRHMRLRVYPGGAATLVVPWGSGERAAQDFLRAHTVWLRRAIARMRAKKMLPVSGRRAYLAHREEARAFIEERVRFWNDKYGFSYGRITIKNTRSMWGSCSKKGNLNFSYLLLFLPRELADYVVVHELCHLKEMNHGRDFWTLVAREIPDYQKHRRALRAYLI